jgi:hypothetical protein
VYQYVMGVIIVIESGEPWRDICYSGAAVGEWAENSTYIGVFSVFGECRDKYKMVQLIFFIVFVAPKLVFA